MSYLKQCAFCGCYEVIKEGVKPVNFGQHKSGYVEIKCLRCKAAYTKLWNENRKLKELKDSSVYEQAQLANQFWKPVNRSLKME